MDIDDIYWIGQIIQYVKRIRVTKPTVKGENHLLYILKRLESYLEKNELNHDLQLEVSQWVKKLDKNYKENQKLTDGDTMRLYRDAFEWGAVINRLLIERRVLELIRTGALNQKALLDLSKREPSAFFEEKTWNALSDIEKSDFSDGAKCLLTGTPTPAVMVALRGAEATVKKYYEFKIGAPPKKKVWGKMVRELESRADDLKIQDTFLGYLDYIREAKRNFAEHPNKIFCQREAELVFMEVLNLVQDTYAEILQPS